MSFLHVTVLPEFLIIFLDCSFENRYFR